MIILKIIAFVVLVWWLTLIVFKHKNCYYGHFVEKRSADEVKLIEFCLVENEIWVTYRYVDKKDDATHTCSLSRFNNDFIPVDAYKLINKHYDEIKLRKQQDLIDE